MRREHVHLVDHVDLEAALDRTVRDRLHELAHLVDLGMRRAVDLEDVERDPVGDLAARGADVAGLRRRPALAVERLGEDPGGRGLADTARAREEKGMRDAIGRDRRLERPRDVLLPNDIGEALRPQAAREHLVAHARPGSVVRWPRGIRR